MTEQLYQIKNEYLQVTINAKGACLWSILDKEGTEFLWQADPEFWDDKAPNLFPYIARMTEGKYTLDNKEYHMDIHGFAKDSVFEVADKAEDSIRLRLSSSAETKEQYPYNFVFEIAYILKEKKIEVVFHVENQDDKCMHFAVGGHPGFCVPLEKTLSFEDYYLEFDTVAPAKRVEFSKDVFVTGVQTDYQMENGNRIPLQHSLFDDDAIILTNMPRKVSLMSDKGSKGICVDYPDMPYVGFWHWPHKAAPYVCIEPWSSLPSRQGIVEDLATQPGLLHLEAGGVYVNCWSIEIIE